MKKRLTFTVDYQAQRDALVPDLWVTDADLAQAAAKAALRIEIDGGWARNRWFFPDRDVALYMPPQTDFDRAPSGYLEGRQPIGTPHYVVDFEVVPDIRDAPCFLDGDYEADHIIEARPSRDVILRPSWVDDFQKVRRWLRDLASDRFGLIYIVADHAHDAFVFRFELPIVASDFRRAFARHETGLTWGPR